MNSAQAQERFVQDRFGIGFWVDPPMDDRADERYAEIAAANFTFVIGGFGANTLEKVQEQLKLCEKYDLKAVVSARSVPADQLPESPACWGYSLRDEPNANDFAGLRTQVDAIRAARPGKLAYINLFPDYANAQQLGTDTYDEHVARFIAEVDTDVLSMDHYPLLQPGRDGRAGYCRNLEVMRKYSLQQGTPFWNFFNIMPYGPHFDPIESAVRWQVYTSVAYGAKGVMYFCYYTPAGGEFPKGGAIIARDDKPTHHYDQARRINAALKNLGPTLMQLTSTGVYRYSPASESAAPADTPIASIEGGDYGEYLIGTFTHSDGRRAVMLCNYDYIYTTWPTVAFDVPVEQVVEVCQETGQEIAVRDESPDMEGLQLPLDSGSGRLFLLPPKE